MTSRGVGICLNGFTALRSEPKSSAEMISSLVFGERYNILEQDADWVRVSSQRDSYLGWISKSNHHICEESLNDLSPINSTYRLLNINTKEQILLAPGCFLPTLNSQKFNLAGQTFDCLETDAPSSDILKTASLFLGTPYLWGGKSIYGIDCSGFVQMVFSAHDISLPRDSGPQSLVAAKTGYFELEKGDLVFFSNEIGKVFHVGIVSGENEVIHASASVHKDRFTKEGIFNSSNELTHAFAWGIKKSSLKKK